MTGKQEGAAANFRPRSREGRILRSAAACTHFDGMKRLLASPNRTVKFFEPMAGLGKKELRQELEALKKGRRPEASQ